MKHVPRRGPAIIIANHSGYAGADAIILLHLLRTRTKRAVRVMAHPFYFDTLKSIRAISFSFGLREADYHSAIRSLNHGRILVVFPEGVRGNFKSSLKRYHLQPFHSGFVRMAMATGAPIIPCIITGAEESHWNLGSINLGFLIRDLRIPIPLNLIPLPSKWRIRFLEPIHLRARKRGKKDLSRILKTVGTIRIQLQKTLSSDRKRSKFVYVPPLRHWSSYACGRWSQAALSAFSFRRTVR
jgi:1-acyl-sn-glycerol-3-phosphate acyltransferase